MDLSVFDSYTQVPKAWGREIWLCNTPLYCAKLLVLEPGFQCSLHYHPIKDETFLMLEGEHVWLEFGGRGNGIVLAPGDTAHIVPTLPHRFEARGAKALLLEVSTQHSDEDVIRLEESGPTQGERP